MRTFTHFLGVLARIDQPRTKTTTSERAALCRHLGGRKTIVELGVAEGVTTRVLADGSDADATVFGVDPFFRGRAGICWGEKIASMHLAGHLRQGKVRFVRTLSTEVGERVPPQVDFVFVDGDHSPEGIRKDWAFWPGRLNSDGIIALHDSIPLPGRARLGSHDFYDSHIRHDGRFRLLDQVDSLVVLQKVRGNGVADPST